MDDLIKNLRANGVGRAAITQQMAAAKSERNRSAGEVTADYQGLTKEQTIEWQAAAKIEQLSAALTALRDAYWVVTDSLGLTQHVSGQIANAMRDADAALSTSDQTEPKS